MIAFCTRCWAEMDASANRCASCNANLTSDLRTYGEKLVAALEHPLPEVRERICWLIGENKIVSSIPHLVKVADHDSDLFVRRAACKTLAALQKRTEALTVDCL